MLTGTIDVPTRGDLHLCGSHITPKTTDFELAHTRLSSLGFVFQTFNLLSGMTAVENVEMPMVRPKPLSSYSSVSPLTQLLF